MLARALGVPLDVVLRGGPRARRVARELGASLVAPGRRRDAVGGCAAVVVDDPSISHALSWCRAARSAGVPVVSLHDLGIGLVPSNLAIDGSIAPGRRRVASRHYCGPRFAILEPARTARPAASRAGGAPTVLVSLGGGPRIARASRLAGAIARACPGAEVRLVAGFEPVDGRAAADRARWPPNLLFVEASEGLVPLLVDVTVAVVGGGISLYEASSCGVATVPVAVVDAQRRTIEAFRRSRAAGGPARALAAGDRRTPERLASAVARLLANPRARTALGRRARRLVDGGGTTRVVGLIDGLLGRRDHGSGDT